MRPADVILLAIESLRRHWLRTCLSLVAVAIGAAAVLLLTTLGEAAKRYVMQQFAALGTNSVAVLPGRTETSGMGPGVPVGTRDLTIEDAEDIRRRASAVIEVAPFSLGTARMEFEQRHRDVYVVGTTSAYARMLDLSVSAGQFLFPGDPRHGVPVVVIGSKLRHELFGPENPLGKSVRLAGSKFRVIGIVEPKGQVLGIDFDEHAIVPVASALRLFNRSGLTRVLVQAPDERSIPNTLRQVRAILTERHRDEDFTFLTQDAMLQSFRSIIGALTLALSAIAAISLAVAGIGIMNVMLVSVAERVTEVGVLKALGGRPEQIASLFLAEALLLSGVGGISGIALGAAILHAAGRLWPSFPLFFSSVWAGAILAFSLSIGALFGILPARRAARLPAADALRGRR